MLTVFSKCRSLFTWMILNWPNSPRCIVFEKLPPHPSFSCVTSFVHRRHAHLCTQIWDGLTKQNCDWTTDLFCLLHLHTEPWREAAAVWRWTAGTAATGSPSCTTVTPWRPRFSSRTSFPRWRNMRLRFGWLAGSLELRRTLLLQ